MQDLLTEVAKLESRIKECEQQATQKEQEARALRAERNDAKTRLGELHHAINQAVSQRAVQSAGDAARQAQQQAEAARNETTAVLGQLKALQASLSAKEKALDQKLAGGNVVVDTQ